VFSGDFPKTALSRREVPVANAFDTIEMQARVPPPGVVVIAGLQQLWVGNNYGELTVTLRIHLTSIHILLADEVIKTVSSQVTTVEQERLSLHGFRAGRHDPADPSTTEHPPRRRTGAGRNRAHRQPRRHRRCSDQELTLGTGVAGTLVEWRFDVGLIHASAGDMPLHSLPNPFFASVFQEISGTRPATTPLPLTSWPSTTVSDPTATART
jgi:biopolymer transport protein ExbB